MISNQNVSMLSISKWLVFAGVGLAIFGGLIWMASRTNFPLGGLPGDIHFEREGFSLYVPLASCLLLSMLVTIGLNLIARLFR